MRTPLQFKACQHASHSQRGLGRSPPEKPLDLVRERRVHRRRFALLDVLGDLRQKRVGFLRLGSKRSDHLVDLCERAYPGVRSDPPATSRRGARRRTRGTLRVHDRLALEASDLGALGLELGLLLERQAAVLLALGLLPCLLLDLLLREVAQRLKDLEDRDLILGSG